MIDSIYTDPKLDDEINNIYHDIKVGVSKRGVTNGSDSLAGNIGEYVQSVVSSLPNASASTTFRDITSISLSAGDWDVSAIGILQNNGATISANNVFAISTYSGNTTTDHINGNNVCYVIAPFNASGAFTTCSIPTYRISITSNTTIYLKGMSTYSAGTPANGGRISARRVR